MFKLCASLVGVLITIFGVLGNHPNNKATATTTAKPFSDLLSKFHQNDFKLTYERAELVRIDKRYADCHFRTFKYNRTTATPLTDIDCIANIDFGFRMELIIQAYRFASNEYRLFPAHFQVNMCEAINSSMIGFDRLIKNGNVVCPLVKGKKYFVSNFTPDGERFPPFVPNGHYMVELQFWYESKELAAVHGYGIIDRPIPIPGA